MGTSIPPLRLIEGTKSLTVANDTAPIGVLNPGDTVTYNITVKNSGPVVVNNVRVYDTVPANDQLCHYYYAEGSNQQRRHRPMGFYPRRRHAQVPT